MKNNFVVILFYKFIHIADPEALMNAHKEKCRELGMFGRMIVAHEGVNGTFEGTSESVEEYKKFLKSDSRFADILVKESEGNGKAFSRLSIRVRDEVVTLGAGEFNTSVETATELPAAELKKWYENNEDFVAKI